MKVIKYLLLKYETFFNYFLNTNYSKIVSSVCKTLQIRKESILDANLRTPVYMNVLRHADENILDEFFKVWAYLLIKFN